MEEEGIERGHRSPGAGQRSGQQGHYRGQMSGGQSSGGTISLLLWDIGGRGVWDVV